MIEKGVLDNNSQLRERIAELQALLSEIRPWLVAAEVELSERLAAISAFEFRVRSRLEPLTRRMDRLDEEVRQLREQLLQLQEDLYQAVESRDGDLYHQWRSSTEAGAAASGSYRYHQAPASPPKHSSTKTTMLTLLYIRQCCKILW